MCDVPVKQTARSALLAKVEPKSSVRVTSNRAQVQNQRQTQITTRTATQRVLSFADLETAVNMPTHVPRVCFVCFGWCLDVAHSDFA